MLSTLRNAIIVVIIFLMPTMAYFTYKYFHTNFPIVVSTIQNNSLSKKDVENIIKEYINNNPEIIISALEAFQKIKLNDIEKKIKNFLTSNKERIDSPKSIPIFGNNLGDITITMFYDYNCIYCKKANSILNDLIKSDDKIKIIYRPFPIWGENAEYIAKSMLAVYMLFPDKFKEVHEEIMTSKITTLDDIKNIFAKYKIDSTLIENEMNTSNVINALNDTLELTNTLKISGVPAFIINNKIYPGVMSLDQMRDIVKKNRESTNLKPDIKSDELPEQRSDKE